MTNLFCTWYSEITNTKVCCHTKDFITHKDREVMISAKKVQIKRISKLNNKIMLFKFDSKKNYIVKRLFRN